MQTPNAHYVLRIYQKFTDYASSPLVDIPLNFSVWDAPNICILDQSWNIILVKDVINLKIL